MSAEPRAFDPVSELVAQVQRGDRQAFGRLYDRYAAALLGVIVRLVPERKTAEDILQDAFVDMWEKIKAFDPARERLFTWMLAIVRQAVVKNQQGSEIRAGGNPVSTQKHVVNLSSGASRHKALDLIFLEGYTLSEAAKALGCSPEDLKTRIRMEFQLFRKETIDE